MILDGLDSRFRVNDMSNQGSFNELFGVQVCNAEYPPPSQPVARGLKI